MERSTMIAAIASGALILVAGTGAVAAVGSLQDASQESLAIGQQQPQGAVAEPMAAVAVVPSPAPKLKKPKLSGSAAGSSSSGGSSGGSSGSSGSSSGSSSGGSSSSKKKPSSSSSSSREDDHSSSEDHESEDHKSEKPESDNDD